jgi:hypothetical protein
MRTSKSANFGHRKEMKMEKISNVKAIKEFFEADGGVPVTMAEMRALAPAERAELGRLCAEALGKEIGAPTN